MLADYLRFQGWSVIHCGDGYQSDDYILDHAAFGSSVLSDDRDFVALARPLTLVQIVFKDRETEMLSCLRVDRVLAVISSPRQLVQAYLVSGCDDASTSLREFGLIKALDLCRRYRPNRVWVDFNAKMGTPSHK